MSEQKFHRGDVVRIAANLGPHMSHFPADKEAIVMGSYADQYPHINRNNTQDYTLMFTDNGGQSSWYRENQLTLVRHGGESEIASVVEARQQREAIESDLAWIVGNWPTIRMKPSGATLNELMRRIGITNPWGPNGEGFVYAENASGTIAILDEALLSGDVATVEARMAETKMLVEANR